ncbi:MAG: heme-binding protein [Pseudomonadales bacterium]
MRWNVLLGIPVVAFALSGCGGGSGGSSAGVDAVPAPCSGSCVDSSSRLVVADVQRIVAQAVHEARAQQVDQATIAVVDRVGNVLGVFRMTPSQPQQVVIATALDADGNAVISAGLEGIRLPVAPAPVAIDDQAAIAKAVTGAYLSSEGNAFSTRTASQIVQENFNPGERNQPSGPLFGVQFSQLACSDFSSNFNGVGPNVGPKRSPLGLSADPGGFPLYKAGVPVGGVGVIADGLYSVDKVISDSDRDLDEMIALAATFGFAAPVDRRADQITVEGKTFRFSDVGFEDLASDPASAPAYSSISGAVGTEIAVTGYSDGTFKAGTVFGTAASGIRPDGDVNYPGRDAFVFVDDTDGLRFAPRAGTDVASLGGAALTAAEARTIVDNALGVANRARAQIRRPLGSQARVTVSLVDTNGEILAMARTRDAPVFGADVSLQKARTAAFFSSASAADFLRAVPPTVYLETSDANVRVSRLVDVGGYVTAAQDFLNDPGALENGAIAFSDRAGGNLSRPFFPDGVQNNPAGPFSKPRGEWSPFSTGLQLDLSMNALLQHVLFVAGAFPADVGDGCPGVALSLTTGGSPTVAGVRLGNGLQIFPGSVPVFRGDVLVGGIGVSGDGIDQDDMISFLGLHNAGVELGGAVNNAPPAMRADQLEPRGVRLRYVQCPQSPFIDSDEQNVCQDK